MNGAGQVAAANAATGRRFVTFAGVGLVGTGVHFLILLAWVEGAGLPPLSGTAIGFVTGALVNYWLNYRFTFRSTAFHRAALPKFMLVAAVGFCLNLFFMMAGTCWTPLHYLVVQVLATGAVLFGGFSANSLWTFKGKDHGCN